jgi:hypothetical protein
MTFSTLHRVILAIVSLLLLTQTTQAGTTITPTAAPSKTPGASILATTGVEVASSEETPHAQVTQGFEPLTQSDLNVLTGNVQRPNGMVWNNGLLYVACSGDWTLYEINDTSGSTRTYIYGVRNSHNMHIEALSETNINVWVPDYDTNSLMLINQARAPQQITTGLEGPWGIATVDDNTFLITNLGGNNIATVNRAGEVNIVLNDLRSPAGISRDEDFVYFANNGSARRSIEWIALADLLEGEEVTPEPLVSGLQSTTGMVLASDGYLYFTYALGTRGVVGRVDPEVCRENEGCSNDEIEIILYTELAAPLAGLTITPDMRLFVHTIYRPEIYWVQIEN